MLGVDFLRTLENLLDSNVDSLNEALKVSENQLKVRNYLSDKVLSTNYLNRDGRFVEVKFGCFSHKNSTELKATPRRSVLDYFRLNHGILLTYPLLKCVLQYGKINKNGKQWYTFYPLELLRVESRYRHAVLMNALNVKPLDVNTNRHLNREEIKVAYETILNKFMKICSGRYLKNIFADEWLKNCEIDSESDSEPEKAVCRLNQTDVNALD